MNDDPQTRAIIGAAMEVHKTLGHGFLEAVYQEALAEEFRRRGIPFRDEVQIPVFYKETRLRSSYRADFVCYEEIVVEAKALSSLTTGDEAQLLNYLKGTHLKRGLLLNFGAPSLQYRRRVFAYDDPPDEPSAESPKPQNLVNP